MAYVTLLTQGFWLTAKTTGMQVKEGEGAKTNTWNEPCLKTRKVAASGCFYPTLYFDGSQWYHLMHFFLSLSLPLIHKYIYWIWDPFRCLVTFCTLYVKLCHTLYAFKSCGCAVPSQPCLQRITESQWSLDSRIKEMSWFCNQGLRVVEHLGR